MRGETINDVLGWVLGEVSNDLICHMLFVELIAYIAPDTFAICIYQMLMMGIIRSYGVHANGVERQASLCITSF